MVISSLFNTSLQTLPRTAYFKMIDYWFTFILLILVLCIGVHTYIGHILYQDKLKSENLKMDMNGDLARLFKARGKNAKVGFNHVFTATYICIDSNKCTTHKYSE